jgi:WG containing repeat
MRFGIVFLICASFACAATDFKLFEENGRVGMKNDQGQVVIPPSFEALGWSDGSFSVAGEITGYKLNGRWGLINLKKEYITKAEFIGLTYTGADRAIAHKTTSAIATKVGSITLSGKVTIPFIYDAITIHGLRAVVMEKRGAQYVFGLTDLDHKMILPLQYKSLYPVGSLRYAAENVEGKLALFSDTGKPITEFFIDSIGTFYRDHAVVFSNGLQGLMNRDGDLTVPPKYSKIELREAPRALQPSIWKIISPENKELQSLIADVMLPFAGDLFHIERSGKHGLIDGDLKTIWPLVYDAIENPINNIAAVKKGNVWGLLDLEQHVVLDFNFDSLIWDGSLAIGLSTKSGKPQWSLTNVLTKARSGKLYDGWKRIGKGLFIVNKAGYVGLINNLGQETAHCVYDSILEIRDNLVAVKFKQQFGIITTDENWILAPQMHPLRLVNHDVYLEKVGSVEHLKSFKGDIIYFTSNDVKVHTYFLQEVQPDGVNKFVNWSGQEFKSGPGVAVRSVEMPQSTSVEAFHDGLQRFEGQGKFGFRDDRGRLIIPNRYDSAKHFSEGLVAFKLLDKWGYLNTQDEIVVNPTYEFAGNFQSGFARVASKGKYGLIDKQGNLQLALQYDSINRKNQKLIVHQNGMAGLATEEGRIVIQPRYDFLDMLPNNQIRVKLNGSLGVISSDGLSIIPIIYTSLTYDAGKNVYLGHQPSSWVTLSGF